MFLLDTNVISALRKANEQGEDSRLADWARREQADQMYLSVISAFELEIGVLRLERRDPRQGRRLREWLELQVLESFRDRILDVDLDVVRCCAELNVPDPMSERMSERDSLIAATALIHQMTVVTRNERDFKHCSVDVINPWEISVNEPRRRYRR